MFPEINQDPVKKEFLKYLTSLDLSPKSHKNYRSDLNHFLAWVIKIIRAYGSHADSLADVVPFLSTDIAQGYKLSLEEAKTPAKTINRRLSTLRHLSRFLTTYQISDMNFMDGVENDLFGGKKKAKNNPLLSGFKTSLESEKISSNTIKNYLSDIRKFLEWLDKHEANI